MSSMALAPIPVPDLSDPTPVEEVVPGVRAKRDDLFSLHGVNGSKVYQALAILESTGYVGIVGYGGRRSNTAAAMAAAAKSRGTFATFYCPRGEATREMEVAQGLGCLVRRETPGYLSQTRARAIDYGRFEGVPVGLDHEVAIASVAAQVKNLPRDCDRVVVAVGSGVLLTGIMVGLLDFDHPASVLAVACGGGGYPHLLNSYAPGWRKRTEAVHSGLPYLDSAPRTKLGDLELDPLYEAKLIPFVREGDVLWNSGIRTP